MHPSLTSALSEARTQELLANAASWRSRHRSRREPNGPDVSWASLSVRLATTADAPALERLAELDQKAQPSAPVLIGSLMARPVAALSLVDGGVVADPFTPTCDLVELLRLRARQMRHAA
jgi:hypothetical protein